MLESSVKRGLTWENPTIGLAWRHVYGIIVLINDWYGRTHPPAVLVWIEPFPPQLLLHCLSQQQRSEWWLSSPFSPLQAPGPVASCCCLTHAGSWKLVLPCLLLWIILGMASPILLLSGIVWSQAAFFNFVPVKQTTTRSEVLEKFLAVRLGF